ncbi:MAG: FHA domain-containing protein [Thermoguttaceae bacterium]
MRLVLKINSESGPPRLIWLSSGQTVRVGRTEAADEAVPDAQMSSVHFVVECMASGCTLRDNKSTNGTFVNGQKITQAMLRHGDTIQAGQAIFHVEIESENAVQGPADYAPVRIDSPPPAAMPWESEGRHLQGVAAVPPGPPQAPESPPLPACGTTGPQVVRLVLRKMSEGQAHIIWLRPGQATTIGATEKAEHSVANDARMSPVHFQVRCSPRAAYLQDLGSTHGTTINGQRATLLTLHDGDVIEAGTTKWQVAVEYAPNAGGKGLPPPAGYARKMYVADVYSFRGKPAGPQPLELLRAVWQTSPLYMIVDVVKLGLRPPVKPVYLLDWLPRQVAPSMSPVFLPVAQSDDLAALLERAWGNDALVFVASHREPAQVLATLRLAARGAYHPTIPPVADHMLGSCRPSVLSEVFERCSPQYARFVFSTVELFFWECPTEERWQALALGQFSCVLEELGWRAA